MRFCLIVFGLVLPMLVFAGEVTIPNEFEPGAKAVAADVNDNFSALAVGVNDNDSRITINEAAIVGNTSNISANNASLIKKQNRVTGSCGTGQYIRGIREDGAVDCATDAVGSGGDITGVIAGTGLTDGGLSGSVTLNVDTVSIQKRVAGVCAVGEVVRAIAEDGSVTCGTAPTDVVAGDGITRSINATTKAVTVNVNPTYVQRRLNSGCVSGSWIRDIAEDGTPNCEVHSDDDILGNLNCSHLQIARWNIKTSAWECTDGYQVPIYTLLAYNGTPADNSISFTYETFRTIGDFNKVYADSFIELVWNDHGSVTGSFCDFQLRIDDVAMVSGSGRSVMYAAESPISVTAWFSGLAAGAHTVSIWVRGSATNCKINRGSFSPAVFVKEIPQYTQM